MATVTHLGGNILFLTLAGGVVEPYIGEKRVLLLVLGVGFLGTYLANVTAVVHHLWILAGASGGILALWAYAGLRMRRHITEYLADGVTWSRRGVETVGSVALLIGIPVFFVHQLLWLDQPHSGHLIGLVLGTLSYAGESVSGDGRR
jgi:membrane associated rhomboid family serine protease